MAAGTDAVDPEGREWIAPYRPRGYDLASTEAMTMTDSTAEAARLMKVTEAIVAELDRQGVAEAVANLGFDPTEMAKVVICAADGDVIQFQRPVR